MISDKEIARNLRVWIKALRSGKYKQGQGALHVIENEFDENGEETLVAEQKLTHCCLGVAEICVFGEQTHGQGGLKIEQNKALGIGYSGTGRSTESQLQLVNDRDGRDHRSFKAIAKELEKKLLPRYAKVIGGKKVSEKQRAKALASNIFPHV